MKICVLVTHGASISQERHSIDATEALGLELSIGIVGGDIEIVHAGDTPDSILLWYAGLGVKRIIRISTPIGGDFYADLEDYVLGSKPDLVVCGRRANGGEGTGMLPYFLSKAMNAQILTDVGEVTRTPDGVNLVVYRSWGRRDEFFSQGPIVITASERITRTRQSTFENRRNAQMINLPSIGRLTKKDNSYAVQPVSTVKKSLRIDTLSVAADPMKSLFGISSNVEKAYIETDATSASLSILEAICRRVGG